jgi:hypothetical protein
VLEDSKVEFIKVLLWCSNSIAATLENRVQPFACKSPPFTDKQTCRCRLDEESTSIDNQLS